MAQNKYIPGSDADDEQEALQDFHLAFKKRLSPFSNVRISRKVDVINRRLDSLARLLETNQICVAVRYDPLEQALIISSNEIHNKSYETNQFITNIQNMMNLLANHDASMSTIIEELSTVIAINLRQEKRFPLQGLSSDAITAKVKRQLNNLYQSGQKTKDWEESAEPTEAIDAIIIKHTSRLARDFIKLRKSILALSCDNAENKAVLQAMRDKKI